MGTVQMNMRIGVELKRTGDAVLRRHGYSPTEAVRALWGYVSEHGTLPDFMAKRTRSDARAQQLAAIQQEQGSAWRTFEGLTGITAPLPGHGEPSDDELREMAWAEKGAFDD